MWDSFEAVALIASVLCVCSVACDMSYVDCKNGEFKLYFVLRLEAKREFDCVYRYRNMYGSGIILYDDDFNGKQFFNSVACRSI